MKLPSIWYQKSEGECFLQIANQELRATRGIERGFMFCVGRSAGSRMAGVGRKLALKPKPGSGHAPRIVGKSC